MRPSRPLSEEKPAVILWPNPWCLSAMVALGREESNTDDIELLIITRCFRAADSHVVRIYALDNSDHGNR